MWSLLTSRASPPVPNLHADLYMGRHVMLHLVQPDRTYSPETVAVMGAAFDRVCQSISNEMNGNDAAKRTLALIILRLVDRGERASLRLPSRNGQARTVRQSETVGQPGKSLDHRRLMLTLLWRVHSAWLIRQKHTQQRTMDFQM